MTGRGHVAVRSCVGCGGRDHQSKMARIAFSAKGCLRIDGGRLMAGRGAYLHSSGECLALFAKRRGVVRSLRVAVDAAARIAIVAELRDGQSE